MKPDEVALLKACVESKIVSGRLRYDGPSGRSVAAALNIPPKRACYLFEKWTSKGWYDYGVSVDMGWLEAEGVAAAATAAMVK
jgi:hypothetical protein